MRSRISARCSTRRTTPDTDIITTHFEYHSMEENLLKLDMLGHDDPTMIRMMEDMTGVDAQKIPLDDPDTMSIFISSKVLGYRGRPDPRPHRRRRPSRSSAPALPAGC